MRDFPRRVVRRRERRRIGILLNGVEGNAFEIADYSSLRSRRIVALVVEERFHVRKKILLKARRHIPRL